MRDKKKSKYVLTTSCIILKRRVFSYFLFDHVSLECIPYLPLDVAADLFVSENFTKKIICCHKQVFNVST